MYTQDAAVAANGSNRPTTTDSGAGHNGNGGPTAVTDGRQAPFCYQTATALNAIRAHYARPEAYGKLASALGVYLAITEAAARRACIGPDGFSMERACLAKLAGMSVDTFDGYAASLEAAGVLGVIRTYHRPNRWFLIETVTETEETGGAEKTGHKDFKDLNPSSLPTVGSTQEGFKELEMSSNFPEKTDEVKRIYGHWRKVCNKSSAWYENISPARKQKIRCRLKEFSADELCRAIDGVARDPWEARSLQNDLTIIFRNQEQVCKFLELADSPGSNGNGKLPHCKHHHEREGLTIMQLHECSCSLCLNRVAAIRYERRQTEAAQ